METSTRTLVIALRLLVDDIQSMDGVPNAVVAEAADRVERLERQRDIALSICIDLVKYGQAEGNVSAYFDVVRQFEQLKRDIQNER